MTDESDDVVAAERDETLAAVRGGKMPLEALDADAWIDIVLNGVRVFGDQRPIDLRLNDDDE